MGRTGAFLLLLPALCLGCASRHFVSLSRETPRPAPSDTVCVGPAAPSSRKGTSGEPTPDERRYAIEEARRQILKARLSVEQGEPEQALKDLDGAFGLLGEVDVEAEADPELSALHASALEALAETYRQVWPSVAHLSPETPLSALLEMLDTDAGPPLVAPSDDLDTVIQKVRTQSDVPLEYNPRVQRSIDFFTGKGREPFAKWLSRSGRYVPMIRGVLAAEGLPEDLVYLSMIESGFSPAAYSRAHASGLWQFIASTGELYGLRQDWFLDERRDPVKSTRAAARHLKDLYAEFGDWYLALAAYNCGKGRVLTAMRKGRTRDFWELKLPQETSSYVPHFIAALVISEARSRFGFEPVESAVPLAFEEVLVDQITLDVAARCASCTDTDLKALNPELRRWCTPPGCKYLLKIPKGTKEQFLEAYSALPSKERVSWHRHLVARGETLSALARGYGTSRSAIISANDLKGRHPSLQAGSYLLIPVPAGSALETAHAGAPAKAKPAQTRRTYVVKKGDTLSRIALMHGVTVAGLKKLNPGAPRRYIHPGDRLIVQASAAASSRGPGRAEMAARDAASPQPERLRAETHSVRRGETLRKIAKQHGVTVGLLRKWNPLARGPYIHPGDRLTVWKPVQPTAAGSDTSGDLAMNQAGALDGDSEDNASAQIHVVRTGESLWSIADRQGVTVTALTRANGLGRGAVIHPGDKLRIPRH